MKETTNTTVTFPSEDEDMGEVGINWFGPPVTVSRSDGLRHALPNSLTAEPPYLTTSVPTCHL